MIEMQATACVESVGRGRGLLTQSPTTLRCDSERRRQFGTIEVLIQSQSKLFIHQTCCRCPLNPRTSKARSIHLGGIPDVDTIVPDVETIVVCIRVARACDKRQMWAC